MVLASWFAVCFLPPFFQTRECKNDFADVEDCWFEEMLVAMFEAPC